MKYEPTGMNDGTVENIYGFAVFGGVSAAAGGIGTGSWLVAVLGAVIGALGLLGWKRERLREQQRAWWQEQIPPPPCMIDGCSEPRLRSRPWCRQHTAASFKPDGGE